LWKSRAELSTEFSTGARKARSGGQLRASCWPAAGCAIAGRLRGLWRVPGAGGCSCLREGGGGFTGLLRAGMTGGRDLAAGWACSWPAAGLPVVGSSVGSRARKRATEAYRAQRQKGAKNALHPLRRKALSGEAGGESGRRFWIGVPLQG